MGCAMQAIRPTKSGRRWSRFRPRSRLNTRGGFDRTTAAAAGQPRADARDLPAGYPQCDLLHCPIGLPSASAAQGFSVILDGAAVFLCTARQWVMAHHQRPHADGGTRGRRPGGQPHRRRAPPPERLTANRSRRPSPADRVALTPARRSRAASALFSPAPSACRAG
jgi:hypothetical protein